MLKFVGDDVRGCAKARSVAAASPKLVSTRMLSGTSSQTAGAPGCMRVFGMQHEGQFVIVDVTASAASSACALVSATTMATASPTWRTLSAGSSRCGPMKISPPPGAVSFMSSRVFGTGSWRDGAEAIGGAIGAGEDAEHAGHRQRRGLVDLNDARVRRAASAPSPRAPAPAKLKSSVKRPWPVTSRSSSLRGMGWPMKRKPVSGLFIRMPAT